MSQFLTSESLIESVKRRINIPENQSTFEADDLLAFANEELTLSIVPAILSLHEDYLLFSEDEPLVNEQVEYIIPYRAVGNKLYDLQFKDSNNQLYEMSRVPLSDQPYQNFQSNVNIQHSYAIKNNRVVLLPTIDGNSLTGSLRFIYYIRPNSLVLSDRVATITAIDPNTGIVNVNQVPSNFSLTIQYDIYKAKSPHNILAIDLSVSSVNTALNTIEFDPDDLPDFLEVGDQIAQAQETNIPNIPSDLHVYLAQKVAERVLESNGDTEGLQNAMRKSAEMEMRAGNIIDNRVDESPIKLLNRNGPLRGGLRNRRYRNRG